MRAAFLGLAAAAALGGPAVADRYAPISVSPDQLKGASLAYLTHEGGLPPFMLMRPANGAFAAIGAVAAIENSKAYWTKNNMVDPAPVLREHLADGLAAQYRMIPPSGATHYAKLEEAAAQPDGPRYVLDVRDGVNATYQSLHFGHYRVTYVATAKLVDVQTKREVASGTCVLESEQTPTYDELSANEAAFLKAFFAASATGCEARFRANLFKLAASEHSETPLASPPVSASTTSNPPPSSPEAPAP